MPFQFQSSSFSFRPRPSHESHSPFHSTASRFHKSLPARQLPRSRLPAKAMPGSGELLLHGDLELTIHKARGLPNMDVLSTLLRRLCFCPAASPPSPKRSVPTPAVDGDDRIHRHLRRRHKPQPHGHHILPTSDPYAAVVVPGPPDVTLAPRRRSGPHASSCRSPTSPPASSGTTRPRTTPPSSGRPAS
jgi:hypothetical protein